MSFNARVQMSVNFSYARVQMSLNFFQRLRSDVNNFSQRHSFSQAGYNFTSIFFKT